MSSKKFDNVDRTSGKKITALRREAVEEADYKELHEALKNWSILCGKCGYPIGECECY